MSLAPGTIASAANRSARSTARRANRFVDREDDVCNARLTAVAGQKIAATRTTDAPDETALAQEGEQLLEIGQRDLLPFSDLRERNWIAAGVLGEIDHCHDGIPPLGAQPHDRVPRRLISIVVRAIAVGGRNAAERLRFARSRL